VADFQRLRQRKHLLIVFDLLELDGKDLRREPIEVRKATQARLSSGTRLERNKTLLFYRTRTEARFYVALQIDD
jgi:ATP-dependent DNA ligase